MWAKQKEKILVQCGSKGSVLGISSYSSRLTSHMGLGARAQRSSCRERLQDRSTISWWLCGNQCTFPPARHSLLRPTYVILTCWTTSCAGSGVLHLQPRELVALQGPRFNYLQLHDFSQPSVTVVPRDLIIPDSKVVHRETRRQKPHTHKINT